ncbi:hypothetical protein L484_023612 [Morus notabilis]|uniref:Uncharacterized protein n=1 Tax=Morus notabilis TaxID=981085 RepID=W9RGS7_9ROSA|nr:hypothetical protein L484_023612 [Morus notabilis]
MAKDIKLDPDMLLLCRKDKSWPVQITFLKDGRGFIIKALSIKLTGRSRHELLAHGSSNEEGKFPLFWFAFLTDDH